MVSTNNNKGKGLPEDDLRNTKSEEEVKSEAEKEEEEDQSSPPRTIIASIGVTKDPLKFKRGARIRTGGGVPLHILAERTSPPDHSNHAGKGSSEFEEGWGNNSKSWDSRSDRFMDSINHNTELIRNLTYKIDDLKDLVDKLMKDAPPLKE
jgi:hypothetical protein